MHISEHESGSLPGSEPPALEGERACLCGQPEGLHCIDGTCQASGCPGFEPLDPGPGELRIEYEPGERPARLEACEGLGVRIEYDRGGRG
jgi:hypothetical protein